MGAAARQLHQVSETAFHQLINCPVAPYHLRIWRHLCIFFVLAPPKTAETALI